MKGDLGEGEIIVLNSIIFCAIIGHVDLYRGLLRYIEKA